MSKKENRDPYATVCLSRLTTVLDLEVLEVFQALEHSCFVMSNLAGEEKWKPPRSFLAKSSEKLNKLINRKCHRMFGQPLTVEGVHRICPLMDYLKLYLGKEGLFRISGSKKRQEDLKEIVDKEISVDLSAGKFTAHDVASVLKQFLAELPEPLLTQVLYDAFLQIAERDNQRSKNIEALQLLFLFLPPANRQLLQYLLMLLNAVAQNPNNKMTAHNLGLLFSPSIMYIRKQRVTCLSYLQEDMTAMNSAVAFMILNATELFKIPDDLKDEIEFISLRVSQRGAVHDGELPMHRTFCKQIDNKSHKASVHKFSTDALLQLYSDVIDMPDGPVKRNFLERFSKCYPGTPPFLPMSKKRKSPVISSTPKHPSPPSELLTRNPLSPVNHSSPLRTMSHPKRPHLALHPTVHRKNTFDPRHASKSPSGLLVHQSTPVYRYTRTSSKSEDSPVLPKRPKQLVQTPSGCLDTWDPCQTSVSLSGSINGYLSSTPIDQHACRGLVDTPSGAGFDLSLELYSV